MSQEAELAGFIGIKRCGRETEELASFPWLLVFALLEKKKNNDGKKKETLAPHDDSFRF